jgi:hypothetical protein
MKKLVIIIFLTVIFFAAHSQDRGIGLRLGNPMGITYKKYLLRDKAIELGLGTVGMGWHDNYYRNSFRDFDRYENVDYVSHAVTSTIYLQARYLLHYNIPIEGMVGKLDWYWGLGGVFKMANVRYHYRDNESSAIQRDVRTDIDFGPEGILGMEYTFETVPVTIFGDISLMVEIVDRPGIPRGLSGVGARYNF